MKNKKSHKKSIKSILKESINQCIEDFSINSNKDEFLVELLENYEKIKKSLSNLFTNPNNQISILCGQKGFGRKSAINFALRELDIVEKKIMKIEIDAAIFKNEHLFVKRFISQIKDQKEIEKFKENYTLENLFEYFRNANFHQIFVLIIDHIEELASLTKQMILYSLLEWMKNENNGIILFGITSNIMFFEELDKRVKSRLSADTYYFFDYPFEKIFEIIQKRIDNNKLLKINNIIYKALNESKFYEHIENYHKKGKSIEFIINFTKLTFSFLKLDRIENDQSVEEIETIINEEFSISAMIAINFLKDGFYLTKSTFTNPELILLIALKKRINNRIKDITFRDIYDDVCSFKVINSSDSFSFKYSINNFIIALFKLRDIGIIKLEVNIKEERNNENYMKKYQTSTLYLNITYDELNFFLTKTIDLPPTFKDFMNSTQK